MASFGESSRLTSNSLQGKELAGRKKIPNIGFLVRDGPLSITDAKELSTSRKKLITVFSLSTSTQIDRANRLKF
ncbi:hypothetical protein JTE90_000751 [Oedothorax gibbosus]|uniref:Uncharacterized protein n=1 Tax=Oedothorax gibbosus TaxID=931172 RepID=A0AAV6UNK7_9ARAC|nr:hypothetical protein JTE90_000751 [Oedothorax gibbosus]